MMGAARQHQPGRGEVPAAIVKIRVPFALRCRGGRKSMILLDGSQTTPRSSAKRNESALLRALVRANRWQSAIDAGDYASIEEIAKAEGMTAFYVGRILRLCRL